MIRGGEVEAGAKSQGHFLMASELLAVIGGDCVHAAAVRPQCVDQRAGGVVRSRCGQFMQQRVFGNTFNQAEDGAFAARADRSYLLPNRRS